MSETAERLNKVQPSKCWDCARSTGACSWSASLIPVKGWVAIPTKKKSGYDSFLVLDCPYFERDAFGGGLYRRDKTWTKT